MPKSLHESELKDILDALNDLKKGTIFDTPNRNRADRLNTSSISRASRDLIMSFPVLCEDTIDPRTASMICKAVERKAITMMQLIFSANQMRASGGVELLKKWHTNIAGDFDFLDNYADAMDELTDRGFFEMSTSERLACRNLIHEATEQINRENKMPGRRYQDSFSEKSLMSYAVYNGHFDNKPTVVGLREDSYTTTSTNGSGRTIAGNETEFLKKQLMDSDAKKANELVPSLMIVRFMVSDDGSGVRPQAYIERQFVAGVKARLIPVDSYDLFDRIESKNKDRNGLVQLIRATTKEISFVKDYLLAIDQAKMDAIKTSRNKTSGIFKTLEKRATKSVWNRLIGKGNDASCITTMVLSQSGVDFMKKEHNINLMDPRVTSKIMDSYNLLCFVVVDETLEVAHFLYDGDTSFEQISFNSLERESGDGSYKKVINLLSKINR